MEMRDVAMTCDLQDHYSSKKQGLESDLCATIASAKDMMPVRYLECPAQISQTMRPYGGFFRRSRRGDAT
jgi:uncharacterized hydantoinase/oxoprolinase family protein